MESVSQSPAAKSASLWQLFMTFFKIGAFTFGGGWAMISIIEREVVDRRKWLTKTEFLDLLAVAQALPGILAVNIAVAVGDSLRRRPGAVVSAMGAIVPSFTMILVIAIFLTPQMIKDSPTLNAVFKGIRPAVVALIIAPVFTTAKAVGINWRTIAIPVLVALLVWSHWPIVSNPILYIIIGGGVGYLIERKRRKGVKA
ncbi:MAG: chromate transporter [Muribaculaceae bacterium]|nr:chromate transporter [Muribaculaceae bacterium]